MGRDNTGKKQESAQVKQNNANEAADRAARDKATGTFNQSVADLKKTPGYTPEEIASQKAESAGLTHGLYGSAIDTLKRNAATKGFANDAGLETQMDGYVRQRSMADALGQNSIMGRAADQAVTGRRMIPGLYGQIPGMYNQSAMGINGNSGSMINGRMDADSKPTFLQSLALAGVQAAGSAAGGYTSSMKPH